MDSMDPRLYETAKSGNICFLKQIFKENPTLFTQLTPQQNTPLHIAAQFGHNNVVTEIYYGCRSLLARPNLHGDTPLHVAARCGHFPVVEFLAKEVLFSSWTNDQGEKIGSFEMLRVGNKESDTVLHEAVRNGHCSIVEFLLEVDPKMGCFENRAGDSPLFLAVRDGMREVVNLFLTLSPYSADGGSDGQTALHAAVLERHSEIMEDLLQAKPQLTSVADNHGRTALYYASSLGDSKAVERLLEHDSSTAYVMDQHGESPIHIAAIKGHISVIKQIICYCPDSGELQDLSGRNVIHFAVLGGNANVVRYMLETAEFEGLINREDNDGNTPLHLAAIERRTWILRYLMWDKRVNQRSRNSIGQTIFDIDESIRNLCMLSPKNTVTWRRISPSPVRMASEKHSAHKRDVAAATRTRSQKQLGQTLLMVATLIATVTFGAAFTMPGGYNNNNIGPKQGLALLQSSGQLKLFIVSDSIAMTSSISAAYLVLLGGLGSKESFAYYIAAATALISIALEATALAFCAGLTAVLPQTHVLFMVYAVATTLHFSTFMFLVKVGQFLPISDICGFLVYICKMKSKKYNRCKAF